MEVQKLIAPLREYAQSVLDERDDDQKATDRG